MSGIIKMAEIHRIGPETDRVGRRTLNLNDPVWQTREANGAQNRPTNPPQSRGRLDGKVPPVELRRFNKKLEKKIILKPQ